jgi:hypothetical protein
MPGRLLAAAMLIVALNLAFTGRLFFIEFTNHTGSIEAAYIAISHQWMRHGFDLNGWWPLWYGGIPGQNTYPPLLHVVVALAGNLFGISAAYAHHAVTAAMYCLGAVTVLWLAWVLSGSRRAAILAALLFSVTSFSAWLIPNVRHDLGAVWRLRRLHILLSYGEGPHIMALTLLPVAILLLHFALTKRRPVWVVLAAMGLASVVLTNWLGGFALAAAAFAYLLAFHRWPAWAGAAAIGLYAYLLAAPWVPPSTLRAIRTNAQWIGGDFRFGPANVAWLAGLIVGCFALDGLLRRARASGLIRFSAAFLILMGGITLLGEWFGIAVLPQPHRYHIEMELAMCLLAGGVIAEMRPRAAHLATVVIAILAVAATIANYRFGRDLYRPIDMRDTSEYRISRWFDAHMQGRRVYAPSAVQFWLNGFSDTSQLGGGFAQGIINNNLPGADFQIMSGMNAGEREGQIAADWFRVLGVHAVGVNGPRSTEFYKSIRNWKKFEGVLRELWRDGDDVIYEVPQRSASLARVMRPEHLIAAPPIYATGTEEFATYLRAADDPALPDASWTWLSRSSARIAADFAPDHIVSVQMSFHPGWRATVAGIRVPTRADGLHQLVIEPKCPGRCVIDLVYDGGREMRIAQALSALSLLVGLAAILRKPA